MKRKVNKAEFIKRRWDINDRLGVWGAKYCGYPDCTEVTEPGYGRCAKHLKLDEEIARGQRTRS